MGPAPGVVVEEFGDQPQAVAWYRVEHQALLAAVAAAAESGYDVHAGHLPVGMTYFLDSGGHWNDLVSVQQTALVVARCNGDLSAQARAHRVLGQSHVCLGEVDEGERHLCAALTLQSDLDDPFGEATLLMSLGWLLDHEGEHGRAAEDGCRAFELFGNGGHRFGQGDALCLVGWAQAQSGDYEEAVATCGSALAVYRELDEQVPQVAVHFVLGRVDRRQGRFGEAIARYQLALGLLDGTDEPSSRVEMLRNIGDTHEEAGDLGAAVRSWEGALAVLDDPRHPHAQAGSVLWPAARPAPARAAARAAGSRTRWTGWTPRPGPAP